MKVVKKVSLPTAPKAKRKKWEKIMEDRLEEQFQKWLKGERSSFVVPSYEKPHTPWEK